MTGGFLLQQAIGKHQKGDLAGAGALYEAVLQADPDSFDANHLLGVLRFQIGMPAEGVQLVRKALRLRPTSVAALDNLAKGLMQLGRHAEALTSVEEVLQLDPDHLDGLFNRAVLLERLERPGEAAAAFGEAARRHPSLVEAHEARGRLLIELGQYGDALPSLEAVVRLRPSLPEALNNWGVALRRVGRPEAAIEAYSKAIALAPDLGELHVSLATALEDLGQFEEALAELNLAASLTADHPIAKRNLGQALLRLGRFHEGWTLYEARTAAEPRLSRPDLPEPVWRGQDLAGKRLLIHSEQGFGDTLQFCRYAPLAARAGASVTLSVQPQLLRLLKQLEPEISVVASGDEPNDCDLKVALLSLPHLFHTALDTIPPPPPLKSDPALRARWAERLGPRQRPRVGLVWSGNRNHWNDQNRSIPLAEIGPHLLTGVDWYSLQAEVRAEEAPLLSQWERVLALPGSLDDFAETAAVIDELDLVVTIDSSVAHLAASLGARTWLLLPLSSEFRWLLGREDSPWYPTMRIFRQPTRGGWGPTLKALMSALQVELFDEADR